jgi:hypothetical protein
MLRKFCYCNNLLRCNNLGIEEKKMQINQPKYKNGFQFRNTPLGQKGV